MLYCLCCEAVDCLSKNCSGRRLCVLARCLCHRGSDCSVSDHGGGTQRSVCEPGWTGHNSDTGWSALLHIYSVSKKIPPLRLSEFFSFFHKRLRIFNRFFTHLLYVHIYARSQIFVRLSLNLTKLCHIMHDYLVHLICAKCPKRAKTRAFRRLRKSLIALLIVVCGKSL